MDIETTCARFLGYCEKERQLTPNTLAAYGQDLAEFCRFFVGRTAFDITGDEIVNYSRHLVANRRLAPATVKRRLACIRAMYGRLRRQKVIQETPFADVDLRVRIPARLPRCLSAAEVRMLLREAQHSCSTTRLAALLLFATGVRVSELASIRTTDIDLEQRSVRILGKGSRERQVFLPNEGLADALRDYMVTLHQSDRAPARLLVNRIGQPMSAAALRARVRKLAERAGLVRRVTPHMFRHTAATALIEAGVDIRLVQRLLGHQSITTTQIYTHISDRALKAAIVGANVRRYAVSSEVAMSA